MGIAVERSSTKTESQRSGSVRSPNLGWKTLFIIVDAGTAIRNILRTEVLQRLRKSPGLRVVIFSPVADAEFRKELESEQVTVEPLPLWNGNLPIRLLQSLKKELWAEHTDLFSFKFKRRLKRGHLFRFMVLRMLNPSGSRESAQSLLDRLERWQMTCTPALGSEYFDRYNPDLVFFTTLYSTTHCLEIGARQRGIETVSFILSWDNPTTKGPFPVKPNWVIVWNEILRNELIHYHHFRPERVLVSGAPQFDLYASREGYLSREAFFKKWRLAPDKKLITYTTGTLGTSPDDHEVVEMLHDAMLQGRLRQPSQLLVRLHPKDVYERYHRLENRPGLTLQRPGRRAETSDSWNPTHEDMFGLAELMCYSDVVVNMASTITIDAAAFNRPVVNVAFDGLKTKPLEKSCRRFYQFDHYRRIVETGGVKLAHSLDEMVGYVQSYLDDPDQDRAGRRRICEEQCWKMDGQSGRRVANYLLNLLASPQ